MENRLFLFIIVGLALLGVGCAEVNSNTFEASTSGATTTEVRIKPGASQQITVGAASDDDTLIRAYVEYIGEIDFTASDEDDHRRVGLREEGTDASTRLLNDSEGLIWDVQLTSRLLLDLELDLEGGPLEADLRDLRLRSLVLKCEDGHSEVWLPARARPIALDLRLGNGDLWLNIPARGRVMLAAPVQMRNGDLSLVIGDDVPFVAEIEMGRGTFYLDVPDAAPVRIEIRAISEGDIRLPGEYLKVSGDQEGSQGVWESANYDPNAADAISVVITHAQGDINIE